MKHTTPQPILLSDYTKHDFRIDCVRLTFELHPTQTIVTAISTVHYNSDYNNDLILDGEKMILKYVELRAFVRF